jgi:hypothetical protein
MLSSQTKIYCDQDYKIQIFIKYKTKIYMRYNPCINPLYKITVPTKCTKLYLNQLYTTFYIYVGESKIIRTVGTCFAIGYTAGWA